MSEERYKTGAAVYIIFEKEGKVLLGKRINTNYRNGFYGLVQGHVEYGESVSEVAIREAFEEAGVVILPKDLIFALVCHNRVDSHYSDYIFLCKSWIGDIKNSEPDKCEELKWFDVNSLPENTIFQIKEYIKSYRAGIKFLELK